MPAIWFDNFDKPNGRLLLTRDITSKAYVGDFSPGTFNTDTIPPFVLHITSNQLVLEQTTSAGVDLELRATDFILDLDVNTTAAGIPYTLFWRVSKDQLSFINLQLKNGVGSRGLVNVNGVNIFNPGNIYPQLNSGDKIQIRVQGNVSNVLWNGVVGWTYVMTRGELLGGTLFQLLHTSGPTIVNQFLVTTFDNYLPSFSSYTSPDVNGNIFIYDTNWNLVNIQFVVNSGQAYPKIRFVDPNPIPNVRSCPMFGEGDTIRILADNGTQPGFGVSQVKFELGTNIPPIIVDVRNTSATLFTINRLYHWPLP